MRVLITGPQGSGKTTQAELVSKKLKIPMIDIGQALRNFAKGSSEMAKKVRQTMDQGSLSPDDIVASLMKQEIAKKGDNFVADGYPRSLDQLRLFDPGYDLVFYLDIAEKEVLQRLLKRGREDDEPQTIKNRLQTYHLLTEPLLEKFKERKILVIVPGDDTILNIHQKIMQVIKDRDNNYG